MEESGFWDDHEAAEKHVREANRLKGWIEPCHLLKQKISDLSALQKEAEELGDEEFLLELTAELESAEKLMEDLELRKMLSGELDQNGCYLAINAGAGGTESCDWAEMLARMYQRWAAKRKWKIEEIDRVDGEVAGIKSITFKITGDFAYGYAKSEKGVHRLVRISPFDSNARRHTSFASVDVTPVIEEEIAVEIRPEEVRIDTYRASGAGGQHVNKTDSAVRLTHLPTGITVSCQSERSQLQNKETCYRMLRAKLYEQKVLERQKKVEEMQGQKMENAWGSQIRNYVFHPYTLVKDTRTKVEMGNIHEVMDGNIDLFVSAFLKEFGT